VAEQGFEIGGIERGGGTDAALGGAAGQISHDDEGRAGEGMGFLELGLTAIGEAETAARAGGLRHAIRKSAGEVMASVAIFARCAARKLGPSTGEAACIVGSAGAIGAEAVEAAGEINVIAAETSFTDEHGEFGGVLGVAVFCA